MMSAKMMATRPWLRATTSLPLFCTFLFLFFASPSFGSLIKRDNHDLVIPLTYEPASLLMTASISIGKPASSYNLIVDTGSPFLVLQSSIYHQTQSTWDPSDAPQPDLGKGGYMTTTPGADDKKEPVSPKMHFVTDTAYLNEGSGQRAGGGAKGGNVTVGLTQLDDLKKANGILGLSPPFSSVKAPAQPQQGGAGEGGGKRKRHAGSAAGGSGGGGPPIGPSLDVSFLHSYLSPDHRKTLGITGSSHFYVTLSASSNNPPTGELIFPLSGTNLPPSIPGFAYENAITIDPSSGSTFPTHPFWGIAHRKDLHFYLDDAILPDIKIDAILLDSGTSGIVGPPSEVNKIFAAASPSRIANTSPQGSKAVLGKANCAAPMKMGFEIGDGKRAGFDGVRRKIEVNGQQLKQTRNVNQPWVDPNTSQQRADGLMPWKSYVDMGVNSYVQGVNNVVQGVTGWLHLLWQPWLGPIGGGYGGYGGSLPSTTEGDNAAVDGGGGGTGLGLGLRKRSPLISVDTTSLHS